MRNGGPLVNFEEFLSFPALTLCPEKTHGHHRPEKLPGMDAVFPFHDGRLEVL
jgi:hypothetical protein